MYDTDDLKGYIPKDTTQQTEFVKKYPNFDGRGLLIAILDTGIDVGFNGMQKTSIGLPKIVDCFDFTGAGNVDTSIVRESDDKNVIIGLSGRSLKIPSKWINPSGKWHLGLKSIYELCSEVATESIIKIRKKSIAKQNELILKQSKSKNDENHKSLVEYLKMTEDLSNDSLVADCIVWNNGEKWQACIDTSFKGNLKKIKVLKDFPENYEYGTFWNILNYCIKIHENGNLLQIFSAASEHGNYVSHVAAACFPNEPERNGLAPGAQLVSMTVLDNRNGNCVNCNAVLKSFQKCIEMKVDIINCSFQCLNIYFGAEIKEMSEKHGIIFIQSAGNDGPFYSSVSKDLPPFSFVIGSVLTKTANNEITYDIPRYSSRGHVPSTGVPGITFAAPGNVDIILPKYYSTRNLKITGTSISAPIVAGSIACLLSGLKAYLIKYSPTLIKFGLSKTAFLPKNKISIEFGHGIIQIKDAFEFFKSSEFLLKNDICNCNVKILNGNEKNGAGIFLMLKGEEKFIEVFDVEILNNSKKLKHLQITSNSENFIEYSKLQKNLFKLKIDTSFCASNTEFGTIKYGEIYGINSIYPKLGKIFQLPITIISPRKITKEDNFRIHQNLTMKSGTTNRFFILPQKGSYHCILKITALEENISSQIFVCYAVEGMMFFKEKQGKFLNFNETNKTQTYCFKICWGSVYEIVLLPNFTAEKEELNFKVEIECFGIYIEKPEINAKKNNVIKICDYLESLTSSLSVEFNKVSYNLIPINVCNEIVKDVYSSNSTEYLRVSYNFTIMKETKCDFKITSKTECSILRVQVYTESKKYVFGFISASPKSVTLSAGTYIIAAYILQSPSITINTPIENLPEITLTMNAYENLNPDIYSSLKKKDETRYTDKKLISFNRKVYCQIYFKEIKTEKLPSPLPSTISLHGTLNFKNEDTNLIVSTSMEYIFPQNNKIKESNAASKDDEIFWLWLKEEFFNLFSMKNNNDKILNKQNSKNENDVNLIVDSKEIKSDESFIKKFGNLQITKSKNDEISEILILKQNPVLTEILKNIPNIPMIFTEDFDFKFIKALSSNPSINDMNDENDAINIKIKYNSKNFAEIQNEIFKIWKLLLKNENKDLIRIKIALIFGHFGTALLCLNKLRIKNHTNPNFKFSDLMIIELLKHLKWNHLVEAHQHSFLDNHRSFYRLL